MKLLSNGTVKNITVENAAEGGNVQHCQAPALHHCQAPAVRHCQAPGKVRHCQ